ncbi:MAG: hypothetical protein WCG97_03830 [bacterium]
MKNLGRVLILGLFARSAPMAVRVAEAASHSLATGKNHETWEELFEALRIEGEKRRRLHLKAVLEKYVLPRSKIPEPTSSVFPPPKTKSGLNHIPPGNLPGGYTPPRHRRGKKKSF